MAEEEEGNKSSGISGLIIDEPEDSVVEQLVEEVIVCIRLTGQKQVYA